MSKKESRCATLSRVKREMDRPRITKSARSIEQLDGLFESHRLHLGLYKRVAERLRVDASFVSRVARGTRTSESVKQVLIKELQSLRDRVC